VGRGSSSLLKLTALLLGFLDTLGEETGVFSSGFLGGFGTSLLEGKTVTLALKGDGGDKALDLGGLGVAVLFGGLGLDLATDDILADIVLLAQVEELADVVSTLGTKALGNNGVGKTGNVLFTLLDNNDREDRKIGSDNATTNGLSLALTGATGAVA